jgi:hypothetical protein
VVLVEELLVTVVLVEELLVTVVLVEELLVAAVLAEAGHTFRLLPTCFALRATARVVVATASETQGGPKCWPSNQ